MSESKKEETAVALITKSEISKVENPILNARQLDFLLKKTPKSHIYKRKAKGGGEWNYVTGVYVKKVLNLMFGWDWSFEVKEHKFDLVIGQAFVLGKLTVYTNGRSIIKEQFGRVDIKFKREPDTNGNRIPLDIGNDLKAATTDSLKKCAAELGIASDVYAPNEFKELRVFEDEKELKSEALKRIEHFIANCTSVVQLETAYESIPDEQVRELYDAKMEELKNTENAE